MATCFGACHDREFLMVELGGCALAGSLAATSRGVAQPNPVLGAFYGVLAMIWLRSAAAWLSRTTAADHSER